MVDFETSSSKSEVSKSNSWKITSYPKTMALQRVPFPTMFYTINLSLLLVTKKGFLLIIILSNYQQYPLHLNIRHLRIPQLRNINLKGQRPGNKMRTSFKFAVSAKRVLFKPVHCPKSRCAYTEKVVM